MQNRRVKRQVCLALLSVSLLAIGSCANEHAQGESKWKAEQRKMHQQDSISLKMQQQSIAYYDSLRETLLPQVDSLLPMFLYEKDAAYEDHGKYIHPLMKTENNLQRCYLQAYITDDVGLVIRCHYYGSQAIEIQSIDISSGEWKDQFTGSNYAFEAEGIHETVTLDGNSSERLLQLADHFGDSPVKCSFTGQKGTASFNLTANEKDALRQTRHLYTVMHDIKQLENQIHNASQQIRMYEKRIENHQSTCRNEKK